MGPMTQKAPGELHVEDRNMMSELFPKPATIAKRGGPPNRMNDLPYRDWMKFQKSFFRVEPDQDLVERCLGFFTKARWPTGEPSRSLIGGFAGFQTHPIPKPRVVVDLGPKSSIQLLLQGIQGSCDEGPYDFVLLDLRRLIRTPTQLDHFLHHYSDSFFATLRQMLVPDRYAGVLVQWPGNDAAGFPIPWSVALASREHMKLRDEKVGIDEKNKQLYYCLFMQGSDDERQCDPLDSASIRTSVNVPPIPAWIIPKSPPRKKNEILHPAKFPETLITEFVEFFTEPGQTVFDPMAGTGSAVLASLRVGRSAYGLELSSRFAEIARDRVRQEPTSGLFASTTTTMPKGIIWEGDAMRIDRLPELAGLSTALERFDPCVSPAKTKTRHTTDQ